MLSTSKNVYSRRLLSIFSLASWLLLPNFAQAQLIPDNTLGAESSVVTPQVLQNLIEGGAIREENLFHSFTEFNVNLGEQVYFANPDGILNILTRVTGFNPSNINGILGVDGGANLFLLNPNGINFGAGAFLDVSGSFFATTAESFVFDNGAEFSATNPQEAPLLTINITPGLQYGSSPQAPVTSQGNLQVGQDLNLFGNSLILPGSLFAGNDINLNATGDIIVSSISSINFSRGGDINITSTGGNINFLPGSTVISTSVQNQGLGGNITLSSPGTIAVPDTLIGSFSFPGSFNLGESAKSGDINVTANSLTLTGGGVISTVSSSGIETGDINIQVDGTLVVDGFSDTIPSLIGSVQTLEVSGLNGDINIEAGSLIVSNGGTILSNPNLVAEELGGKGGDINITTNSLDVLSGGNISASASGVNVESGDINIQVQDNFTIDGVNPSLDISNISNFSVASTISSGLELGATGTSGDINIATGSLIVSNGGIIDTSSGTVGNAGNINIQAENEVRLEGIGNITLTLSGTPLLSLPSLSSIQSTLFPGVEGNGGNITINAGSLSVQDGAAIFAVTSGQGDAGNVDINVRGNVNISGLVTVELNGLENDFPSSILTSVNSTSALNTLGLPIPGEVLELFSSLPLRGNFDQGSFVGEAIGNGGDINIQARSLTMADGGFLTSFTGGQGNAGNISIQVDESVSLISSFILSDVIASGMGVGGDIEISARSLTLNQGSQISARLAGASQSGGLPAARGTGGNIRINTTDFVDISGVLPLGFATLDLPNVSTSIDVEANSSGLFVNNNVGTIGSPGTIEVNTTDFRVTNGGIVSAFTANDSDAGGITINANTFAAAEGGQIVVSTLGAAKGGDIILNINQNLIISGSDPNFAQRLEINPDGVFNQGTQSGIFANTTAESTGDGGSIFIDPVTVSISDAGRIILDSQGTGIGGNIELEADFLFLDEGIISTETASTDGGNLTFNINNLLLMQNESLISATAGNAQSGGNGGSVFLDTGFLVAFPSTGENGSDIAANAFRGDGGRVNITADGIFGIQFRDNPTPDNDITVTSVAGSDGIVQLNTPDTNPAAGLNNLPSAPANPQPIRGCQTITDEGDATFVDKGRGGLPPNPYEALSNNDIWEDVETPTQLTENPRQIIEAQGWIINEKGNVELVADVAAARARMGCG